MTDNLSPADTAKLAAAERAVSFVQDGMRLGLGTGSTAAWMVRCLGRRVRDEGLQIVGVPTSEQTAVLARAEGIEIVTLEEAGWLDLTIDGADEFDGDLNLIKGGGGALLREKIVASASDRMIVIADAGKHVAQLGDFPLPVEVIRFGWQSTRDQIAELLEEFDVARREITLRLRDDVPFVTDEGNYILDLELGQIADPRHLALLLNQIPGTVENGLFIDLCDLAIVGHVDGNVTLVERTEDDDGFDNAV
ncbi:MAG: ribose-5-phosphate isomerase RpiA [Paracoccaceae bacterium]|jgi:ribose 5-phosphate isomerase A|nr:ribose-5-phosphate isomerase RpiA [Paracoccaceae bacterium]